MKSYSRALAALLVFCFVSASPLFAPVKAFAADTPVVVTNKTELLNVLLAGAKTLSPTVAVTIENYAESEYDFDIFAYLHIAGYTTKASTKGKTTTLTYVLTYTMAERVLYALQGGSVTLDDKEAQVQKAAKKILADLIKPNMTEYDKELVIHDYIVDNALYSKTSADMRSPYGILIKKEGVCQGYSETARMLLSAAGVWIDNVGGKGGGGDHMWNIVKISDKYYWLDTTWDDPAKPGETPVLSHVYFNLTDAQLEADHQWDKELTKKMIGGDVTATDMNYMKLNKLIANSNEDFQAILIRQYDGKNPFVEIYCLGIKAADVNLTEARKVLKEKTGAALTGYSVNKALGVQRLFYKIQ